MIETQGRNLSASWRSRTQVELHQDHNSQVEDWNSVEDIPLVVIGLALVDRSQAVAQGLEDHSHSLLAAGRKVVLHTQDCYPLKLL